MIRAWVLIAMTALCGGALAGCGGEPAPEAPSTITLKSSAFAEGQPIPKLYTCDGDNVSPPLEWSNVPKEAKSLALIVEDPDAPLGLFTHWIVYNLPPTTKGLPQGVRAIDANIPQGRNDFGKVGYGGPCPPSGTHRYVFRLYALNDTLDRGSRQLKRAELLTMMRGRSVAMGALMGTYGRKR
jgi:hypothetical protein